MQALCTAYLQFAWLKAHSLVYPTILALEWEMCEMCPSIHARKRSRKALLWEAASFSFLKAILGRQDIGSKQQPVHAGEAAKSQVGCEGKQSAFCRAMEKLISLPAVVWFGPALPLRDCWKRPSLQTSVILTRKTNLDYNK